MKMCPKATVMMLLVGGWATVAGATIPAPPPSATLTTATTSSATVTPIAATSVAEAAMLVSAPPTDIIWDLDVHTNIVHPRPGDLTIVLVSPSGYVITLSHKNGADASFNGTTWDDQAAPGGQLPYLTTGGSVSRHPYQTGVLVSTLAPEEPLGAVRWGTPGGLWKLRVYNSGTQTGSINGWSIDMGSVDRRPPSRILRSRSVGSIQVPDGGTADVSIPVSAPCDYVMGVIGARVRLISTRPDQFAFSLARPNGDVSTLSYRNGGVTGASFSDTWFRETTNPGGDVPYTTLPGLVRSEVYNGTPMAAEVPEEPLSNLLGQNPNGTWKLRVSDFLNAYLAPTTVGVAELDLELTGCHDLEDFDSDERPDLIWRNPTTGANEVWLMNGRNLVQSVNIGPYGIEYDFVGTGDFGTSQANTTLDGKPDIIWRHAINASMRVWFMNGTIGVADVATNPTAPTHTNWKIGGVGDVDGNFTSDLLWNNKTSGKAVEWTMNGVNKTWGFFTTPDQLPVGEWEQVSLADMGTSSTVPELDGWPDIVWRNNTTRKVVAWFMSANGIRTDGAYTFPDGPGLGWTLRAVVDLGTSTADTRPDGWPDLIWQNDTTAKIVVWYMKGLVRTDSGYLVPDGFGVAGFNVVGPR